MGIFQNLSGTTSKSFKIGKYGPILNDVTLNEKDILQVSTDILTNGKLFLDATGVTYIDSQEYTGTALKATKLSHNVELSVTGAITGESVTTDFASNSVELKITSVDASKLSNTISWEIIEPLVVPLSETDKTVGSSNLLARSDHNHDNTYAKLDNALTFKGDVAGSGSLTENEIELTIQENSVESSMIVSLEPTKITKGTIGTADNPVNLIGTASEATHATNSDYATHLSPSSTIAYALVYQNGKTTNYLEPGASGTLLKSNGSDKVPSWVNQSDISVGSANKVDITAYSGTSDLYLLGISSATATNATPVSAGTGIKYNPTTKKLTATTFVGDLEGNAATADEADYATYIGNSTNKYSYSDINTTFTSINTKLSEKVHSVKIGSGSELNTNGVVTLPEYSEGATKTENSTTNGNIKIDGEEVTVYTLPVATSTILGGVKVDVSLNTTSENPVQNKVVNSAITTLRNESVLDSDITVESSMVTEINGNKLNAEKATKDASGNTITATYETKTDASSKLKEAKEYTDDEIDKVMVQVNTNTEKIGTVETTLSNHITNVNNPHSVTKDQVGLSNVTNVATSTVIESGSSKNITSGAVYTALFGGTSNISVKNATVNGDLVVKGNVTSIEATNLEVKDQTIELYKRDNTTALTGYAGLYVKNYDGANSGALVFDNTGTAYVGDVSVNASGIVSDVSLRALTTRKDLTNGSLVKWNSTEESLVNAVAGTDYIPVATTTKGNYYKVSTNDYGLVVSGQTSLTESDITGSISTTKISGNFSANRITYSANASYSAGTVGKELQDVNSEIEDLQKASITLSGNVTGSGNINGTITTTIANGAITAGMIASNQTITATLSGNASTATKLKSPFTISLSGNASGSVSTDGSSTATIDVTNNYAASAGTADTAEALTSSVKIVLSSNASGSVSFSKGGTVTLNVTNNYATSAGYTSSVKTSVGSNTTTYTLVGALNNTAACQNINTLFATLSGGTLTLGNSTNNSTIKLYQKDSSAYAVTTLQPAATASNATITLPSETGTLDTVDQRNAALGSYLKLTGGSLSGKLSIYNSDSLLLVSSSTNGSDKSSKLTTLTRANGAETILHTNNSSTSNTLNVGGSTSDTTTTSPDVINFVVATSHDSTSSKRNVIGVSSTQISISDSVNIIPSGKTNIGSSTNKFSAIYSDTIDSETILENGVSIDNKYVSSVSNATTSTPTLVPNTSTVITGLSVSNGVLKYNVAYAASDPTVTQENVASSNSIPLLLSNKNVINTTTSVTGNARYSNKFYVNPSTGVIVAPTFSGSFSGNASSATVATSLASNSGSTTLPVYFSDGKPVATSTTLGVCITGNAATADHADSADSATKATKDGDNQVITDTYAKKVNSISSVTVSGATITVVDGVGNSTAKTIDGVGSATSAGILTTSRNFSITGGATAASVSFNGSGDVALNVTSIDPAVIKNGVIGTSSKKVDLVGNAATATAAKNIQGGASFSIPYQTASSTTAFIPYISDGTPSSTSEFILLSTNKNAAPTWIKNPYLHINGNDTMTGTLKLKANQNADSYSGALNANNSNIYNLNGLYFMPHYTTGTDVKPIENTPYEGIHFFRSETTVDTLYGKNGKLYLVPNRSLSDDKSTTYTEYELLTSADLQAQYSKINITDIGTDTGKTNIGNISINSVGSGVLNVSKGGTGASTYTANALITGNGTSAFKEVKIGTKDQVLAVNSSANGYSWKTLGSMAYVANTGANTITTLGTVTTGTWNGNVIAKEYLDTDLVNSVSSHTTNSNIHVPSPASANNRILLSVSNGTPKWSTNPANDGAYLSSTAIASLGASKALTDIQAASGLEFKNNVTFCGDITVGGNVNVGKGIVVSGSNTIIDATTLSTEDTLIELGTGSRISESKAITNYAGIYVQKYDGTNSGALVFDNTGTAYVGDVTVSTDGTIKSASSTATGSSQGLQPLATRSSALTSSALVKWDNTNKTLVAATAGTDYVPVASVGSSESTTYVKVTVNKYGLVTGGSTSITSDDISGNIPTSKISGNLSSDRIYVGSCTSACLSTRLTNINTSISTNASAIASINSTKIELTGDLTGSATFGSSIEATLGNAVVESTNIASSAVTTTAIADGAITAAKIAANQTITATLSGNATTATTATKVKVSNVAQTLSYLLMATASSSTSASVYANTGVTYNPSTKILTAPTFSGSLSGNATSADYLRAYSASTTPGSGIKYLIHTNYTNVTDAGGSGNKIELSPQGTSTTASALYIDASGNIYTKYDLANGKIVKQLNPSNVNQYAAKTVSITTDIGSCTGNINSSTGAINLDISSIIPNEATFDTKYVTLTTEQNVPAAKSFGSGIKLGTKADTTSVSYDETGEGCRMEYNTTKKCLQFIFD